MTPATLLLTALATIGTAAPALPDAKCQTRVDLPGHDIRNPIMVVDEAVQSETPTREDIYAVGVHCWSLRTFETVAFDDPDPGITVIVITSKSRVTASERAIQAFGEALVAFRAKKDGDPADAEALVPFGLHDAKALQLATLKGVPSVVARGDAVTCSAAIEARGLGETVCEIDLEGAREVVRRYVAEITS